MPTMLGDFCTTLPIVHSLQNNSHNQKKKIVTIISMSLFSPLPFILKTPTETHSSAKKKQTQNKEKFLHRLSKNPGNITHGRIMMGQDMENKFQRYALTK